MRDLLAAHDRGAQALIDSAQLEGYFDGRKIVWPPSFDAAGRPIAAAGLARRAEIVAALHRGIPKRRDSRLLEAFLPFAESREARREGDRIYAGLLRAFVADGGGDARDFLKLYQSRYLRALKAAELFAPDEGEASLVEKVKIADIPLSRAQEAAETLREDDDADQNADQILAAPAKVEIDGRLYQSTFGALLDEVAGRAVAAVAAGGLLASRYNYLNNFAWFGVSVWLITAQAEAAAKDDSLAADLLRAKEMQLEFFAAHQEDPRRIKAYWYGQQYSYLTRDMADLAAQIAAAAGIDPPPLLTGRAGGRFMEYPDVGAAASPGAVAPRNRAWSFLRWIAHSLWLGREKRRIARETADSEERRSRGWNAAARWARQSLAGFGVSLTVEVHPLFAPMMREFQAERRGVLFLPTHQSVLDHYLMYGVLESPPLLQALAQTAPRPCVIVARAGLAKAASVRVGKSDLTIFGMSSARFDELLQQVDGCIIPRADAPPPLAQLAEEMKKRPALIYPMGTTSAFANQIFPLQHSLFAQLPPQTIIIPIALRGAHALWPKCPKGNLNIRPGKVRAVVAAPMLAETVLLPRRRALRVQSEPAALFHAIHIADLLNPELTAEQ